MVSEFWSGCGKEERPFTEMGDLHVGCAGGFAYSNQLEMIAVNDVGRNRDELRGSQYEGEDDTSSALPN
jgi:hypothetical protein